MNYLWETSNVQPNLLVAFMQRADEVTAVVYLTTEKRDKMRCVVAVGENSFKMVGHYFYKLRKACLSAPVHACCIRKHQNGRQQVKSTRIVSFLSLLCPLHFSFFFGVLQRRKWCCNTKQFICMTERSFVFEMYETTGRKWLSKTRHIFCFLHCTDCCHEVQFGVCRWSLLTYVLNYKKLWLRH